MFVFPYKLWQVLLDEAGTQIQSYYRRMAHWCIKSWFQPYCFKVLINKWRKKPPVIVNEQRQTTTKLLASAITVYTLCINCTLPINVLHSSTEEQHANEITCKSILCFIKSLSEKKNLQFHSIYNKQITIQTCKQPIRSHTSGQPSGCLH